jgi:hypothetical protein
MFLNDAVIACDEALIMRYLAMVSSDHDGVAAAKRKLVRIAETREFIAGLKQFVPNPLLIQPLFPLFQCRDCRHYASENVKVLESIIAESRKLELANHEAVRIVAAQLDRAKRIIIVQQAIASAVSRSNLSDLDLSISTAQQLVADDRDWLIAAIKSRPAPCTGTFCCSNVD